MFGLQNPAAGLAIEQTGIRYISFKNKKSWEVRKKRYLPLRPGLIVENQVADVEALLVTVKQWVKAEGLRGNRVSLSIPPAQIIIRKMSIPSTNPKQVEQLVKLEVETGLHLPFENPVYDYVVTSMDEDSSHLLVFAAPRKPIQDYIDVLEGAGLRVSSVEIAATALARSLAIGQNAGFEETMLINIEQNILDVYMFRSGNPVFIRTINQMDLNSGVQPAIQASMDYIREAAAASSFTSSLLAPGQMLEITAEISRMLNFYQYSLHDGSTRVRNVLIAGPQHIRNQLYEELQQSLTDLEVSTTGLEDLAGGGASDLELNDYRVAAGAALQDSHFLTINLLPQEDREAVLFPYIAVALVGIWLLGVIGTGIIFVTNRGQISDNKQQIQGAQDRSLMLQTELAKLNGLSGVLDRRTAVDELRTYKVNIVPVLNELSSSLPRDSLLRSLNYTYHNSIDLTVRVPSMEASSIYLANLRKMSFSESAEIQRLTVGDTTLESGAVSAYGAYTAVYHVSLIKAKTDDTVTGTDRQEGTGEGDGSGTNQ
ncbi:pilus assembly protein PilM [Paenibacillus tritici]|uniref:Pilus assembly protein PilM n=1 Tax=Paenibacillus tritici TaxID=1873425 RepID=A0ABX2DS29_9BACL|nr:pilus assembly protein PilM [Paenibacillus tritici]NQX47225.1 pilus assembly protein PilM [Paenibacillus tritici]